MLWPHVIRCRGMHVIAPCTQGSDDTLPYTLVQERISKAVGVPSREQRRDPHSAQPIVSKDIAAGLLSLVTRGLLPHNADLTPAMARRPAPMHQGPATVHAFNSQFASNPSAYISPFGFNVANTKLDLISDVGVTLAQKRQHEGREVGQSCAPRTLDLLSVAPIVDIQSSPVESPTVTQVREFDELMDTFSLHHFIIRHGVTLTTTPEYASFQRKYSTEWGAVEQLVSVLENMMQQYSVPLAYVDGQKLADIALDPLVEHDERALIACLVNSEQVSSFVQMPGQRYRASHQGTEAVAATALQAAARGLLSRRVVKQTRAQCCAADRVTRKVKAKVTERAARQKIDEVAAADQLAWEAMNARFRKEWPRIRSSPRVIVHVASISASPAQRSSIPNLDVYQNAQLPRLCDVKESGVDVIYVAPFPVLTCQHLPCLGKPVHNCTRCSHRSTNS